MISVPYLTFNGNCRQAMTFYQACFGGVLHFQTVGDSPLAGQLPEKMKNCILHASLEEGYFRLYATDLTEDEGWQKGNNVSITVHCNSEMQLRELHARISRSGKQLHNIERTFHGALMGVAEDGYGVHWLFFHE